MLSYYLSMVETQEDKEKVEYIFDNFRSYMANAAAPILRNNEQDINDVVQNTMLVIIESKKLVYNHCQEQSKRLLQIEREPSNFL